MIPPQRSSSEDNSGLTMLDIFRYNLGQLNLNWLQIFWIGGNNEGSNLVTREEKVKQLQLYKKKVIEDKKHTLENFRFYKVRKFYSIIKSICIIFFFLTILMFFTEIDFQDDKVQKTYFTIL